MASCASNLKQVALGALMYGQDNDEVYVGWNQGANCNTPGGSWPEHVIFPYVKNKQLFICPSKIFTGRTTCSYWSSWANAMNLNSSYGWNCRGLGNGRGTEMSKVQKPAELFWVADGGNPWRPYKRVPTGCGAGYTSDATEPHNEGRNIAYVDGHVKWMKSSKAYAADKATMDTYLPWANANSYAPGW